MGRGISMTTATPSSKGWSEASTSAFMMSTSALSMLCRSPRLAPVRAILVPIHRHPMSNENVICLKGRLVEIVFEEVSDASLVSAGFKEFQVGGAFEHAMDAQDVMRPRIRLVENERITLDPSTGAFGCVVPAGAWHTVEVLEPSVIYEAKDGKYGEDGSETWDEYILRQSSGTENAQSSSQSSTPESCLGDLRSQITYLIGMERQSGSMDAISPLYVSRMLNVPLEEVEAVMREMGVYKR